MPDHRCDAYDLEWSGKPVVNRCRAKCCGRSWTLDLNRAKPGWRVDGIGGPSTSRVSSRTPTPPPPAFEPF